MTHVFRHAARKGERIVGYRPLPGNLRDAEGRLILEYVYATKSTCVDPTLL